MCQSGTDYIYFSCGLQLGEGRGEFRKFDGIFRGLISARKLISDATHLLSTNTTGRQNMAIFDGKPRQKANANLPPREVPWVEK